jgi:hypothetical protein
VNASDYASAGTYTKAAGQGSCPLAFPKEGLCASIVWGEAPNSAEENKFTLSFFNPQVGTAAAGPFVKPVQTVFVFLWMPKMGHGSSPVTIDVASDGVYNLSRVYFIMQGDWQVRVQLRAGQALVDEAAQNISVP